MSTDKIDIDSLSYEESLELEKQLEEHKRKMKVARREAREAQKQENLEKRINKNGLNFQEAINKFVGFGYTKAEIRKFFNQYLATIEETVEET